MNFTNKLTQSVSFEGVGLHTGANINLILTQAEVGSGIKFMRTDLPGNPVVPADVNYVTMTNRGTTLTKGEVSISTVEHLLAALNALDLVDINISVDGPEIPILDGSSKDFMERLQASNLEITEVACDYYDVTEPFNYTCEQTGAEYAVYPSDELEINVILSFTPETLGDMVAIMKRKSDFGKDIANSRTFVLLSDVEPLFNLGLIKGGALDNALVIMDTNLNPQEVERLKTKFNQPNAIVTGDKIISTFPVRHHNEPARHKVLDILGDLSLVGRGIKAKIIATKPGHTGNVGLAKILKAKYLEHKKDLGRPIYDPNVVPVMDTEMVKSYLPHRFPFLMVDKVIALTDTMIVGVKNITFNEDFFQGHFPGNPIFPGVLQIEALAQTGGILALSQVEDKGSWDTYFLKMDVVKFKAKVVPGDTLILKMELLSPIRRGIVQMKGTAYVGNKIVSEGELTAQIVKRENDK